MLIVCKGNIVIELSQVIFERLHKCYTICQIHYNCTHCVSLVLVKNNGTVFTGLVNTWSFF